VVGQEVKLTLPYPPSTNRYWRVDRRGFAYLSTEARRYKVLVQNRVALAGVTAFPKDRAISLHIDVYRPQRSGDLSNRLKIVEDVLQGLAYEDDRQVVDIRLRRFDDKSNPRVEVEVREALYEESANP
jgi:crossover junction endodeoxyribonuclease RusA